MAKPRRKHPGVSIIEESAQGRHLLALWAYLTGQDALSWKALESLKDGTTVFLLPGPDGCALLIEKKESAAGPDWLEQWGLYFPDSRTGASWLVEFDAYRFDPWLHANETGDHSVADASPHKRQEESRVGRLRSAREKDSLRCYMVPSAREPEELVGVSLDALKKVLEKHSIRLGPQGAVPAVPADGEAYTGRVSLLGDLPEA